MTDAAGPHENKEVDYGVHIYDTVQPEQPDVEEKVLVLPTEPPVIPEITNSELQRFSQMLWDLDVNRLPSSEYELNVQGGTNMTIRADKASGP